MGIETVIQSADAQRLATGFRENGLLTRMHTSGRYEGYTTVREAMNKPVLCCYSSNIDINKGQISISMSAETPMENYERVEVIYHSVFGQGATVYLTP